MCVPHTALLPTPQARAGCERKAFNGDVRALVEAAYGRDPFDLQLETKLYILEKVRLLNLSSRFVFIWSLSILIGACRASPAGLLQR